MTMAMQEVLDRAGHLSELALDRYRFDPEAAAPEWRVAVGEHLAGCAACREALALLAAEDADFVAAPPAARPIAITSARPARARALQRWLAGGAVVLAAAALVFIVTRPQAPGDDGDGLRLRGGPLDFEVFVHDGDHARAVTDGDVVHPGERMAFRVRVRRAGWLLVSGRDDAGNRYLCYPQMTGALAGAAAVPLSESAEPEQLPVAMRFDDILGDEHLTAVFCPAPFSWDDYGVDLAAASTAGCVTYELTLHKRPRGVTP